jgi:hypothetical protein
MTNQNRALCRRIENFANAYRTANTTVATDDSWQAAVNAIPMLINTFFVQRLFDSIICYAPRTGVLRRVSLVMPLHPTKFTVNAGRSEITFSMKASLFSPEFSALVALFLMTDKKLKHPNYSAQAALEICNTARVVLFGELGSDVPVRQTVLDNGDFGERTFFGRQIKGQLVSVQTSFTPIIIAASATLRALPYELMFPNQLVLRCFSFERILLHPPAIAPPPKPAIFRWQAEPARMTDVAIRRSLEEINRVIQAYSPSPQTLNFVEGLERLLPFPMALFSSNADSTKYTSKYPFCTVLTVSARWLPKLDFGLFVMSYSDLSEVSGITERVILDCPFSFFLFIPCQFVREAFAMMRDIFERQASRQHSKRQCDIDIVTRSYDFVTLLQSTLMASLGCPIPVIAPLPSQ